MRRYFGPCDLQGGDAVCSRDDLGSLEDRQTALGDEFSNFVKNDSRRDRFLFEVPSPLPCCCLLSDRLVLRGGGAQWVGRIFRVASFLLVVLCAIGSTLIISKKKKKVKGVRILSFFHLNAKGKTQET